MQIKYLLATGPPCLISWLAHLPLPRQPHVLASACLPDDDDVRLDRALFAHWSNSTQRHLTPAADVTDTLSRCSVSFHPNDLPSICQQRMSSGRSRHRTHRQTAEKFQVKNSAHSTSQLFASPTRSTQSRLVKGRSRSTPIHIIGHNPRPFLNQWLFPTAHSTTALHYKLPFFASPPRSTKPGHPSAVTTTDDTLDRLAAAAVVNVRQTNWQLPRQATMQKLWPLHVVHPRCFLAVITPKCLSLCLASWSRNTTALLYKIPTYSRPISTPIDAFYICTLQN